MNIKRIVIVAVTAIGVVSCDKPKDQSSSAVPNPKQAFEAKPFHGEVYRTGDDNKTLTLISTDECEVKQGGKIFLCKYSKQDDALRVVMAISGTTEVVYYKLVPEGLNEENGAILFNDSEYKSVRKRQEDAARARTEKIAALVAESKQQSAPIFKFRILGGWRQPVSGDVEVKKCWVEINLVRDGKKLHDTIWYGDILGLPGFRVANHMEFDIREPGKGGQAFFAGFELYPENEIEMYANAERFASFVKDWRERYGAAVKEYETADPRLGK